MIQAVGERVLVVGDADGNVRRALADALPGATAVSVASVFDALAELQAGRYTAVLAAVGPIQKRAEAAVRALREQIGSAGRVILFGDPAMEMLSREMLQHGGDDYVICTPPTPGLDPANRLGEELRQVFDTRPAKPEADAIVPADDAPAAESPAGPLGRLPLARTVLDALLHHPGRATRWAVAELDRQLGEGPLRLSLQDAVAEDGSPALFHSLQSDKSSPVLKLSLASPADAEDAATRHALSRLGVELAKLDAIDARNARLQKLAVTDDLTNLHNGRYFRQFLARILERARRERFAVTLLLFDIDNFKQYNDLYGHGVGDEILRQTARLLRQCCREHDLVFRIAGDEFAVVFWEKEGPRRPHDPEQAGTGRIPSTPWQIAQRFRRKLDGPEFTALGETGQGSLTISGGMAVFPFDAQTPDALVAAADHALMFNAKRTGKDRIALVGGNPEMVDEAGLDESPS